ncbi:MAG: hypothetical protein WKF84_14000 [Pyrinomonadaceae bacterium]
MQKHARSKCAAFTPLLRAGFRIHYKEGKQNEKNDDDFSDRYCRFVCGFRSNEDVERLKELRTQIIALEKAGWEAWKNKNADWYQTNLAEDALQVSGKGVSNKSQILKITGNGL